jgi:predicted dehydrogenase
MTLRIGILGAARVATYTMIGAAREVAGVSVAGVAARDPQRAATYAAEHGIARAYPDYQTLIEADAIDAIYVALPPNLHARWSIAALAAGKPVLCEKPFALTPADAEAMVAKEIACGGLLMEAQHSHYHPVSAWMRGSVGGGALGAITAIDARFDAPVPPVPGEIRYDRAVGGGALWDLGVYPAYWARSALGELLTPIAAEQRHVGGDPAAADISARAELVSESGVRVTIACAMDAPFAASIRITGARGWLDITNPLAPHMGHECRWEIDGLAGSQQFEAPSTYAAQLDAFRAAVVDGAPVPTRGADSIAGVRLLTAIDEMARKCAERRGMNNAD